MKKIPLLFTLSVLLLFLSGCGQVNIPDENSSETVLEPNFKLLLEEGSMDSEGFSFNYEVFNINPEGEFDENPNVYFSILQENTVLKEDYIDSEVSEEFDGNLSKAYRVWFKNLNLEEVCGEEVQYVAHVNPETEELPSDSDVSVDYVEEVSISGSGFLPDDAAERYEQTVEVNCGDEEGSDDNNSQVGELEFEEISNEDFNISIHLPEEVEKGEEAVVAIRAEGRGDLKYTINWGDDQFTEKETGSQNINVVEKHKYDNYGFKPIKVEIRDEYRNWIRGGTPDPSTVYNREFKELQEKLAVTDDDDTPYTVENIDFVGINEMAPPRQLEWLGPDSRSPNLGELDEHTDILKNSMRLENTWAVLFERNNPNSFYEDLNDTLPEEIKEWHVDLTVENIATEDGETLPPQGVNPNDDWPLPKDTKMNITYSLQLEDEYTQQRVLNFTHTETGVELHSNKSDVLYLDEKHEVIEEFGQPSYFSPDVFLTGGTGVDTADTLTFYLCGDNSHDFCEDGNELNLNYRISWRNGSIPRSGYTQDTLEVIEWGRDDLRAQYSINLPETFWNKLPQVLSYELKLGDREAADNLTIVDVSDQGSGFEDVKIVRPFEDVTLEQRPDVVEASDPTILELSTNGNSNRRYRVDWNIEDEDGPTTPSSENTFRTLDGQDEIQHTYDEPGIYTLRVIMDKDGVISSQRRNVYVTRNVENYEEFESTYYTSARLRPPVDPNDDYGQRYREREYVNGSLRNLDSEEFSKMDFDYRERIGDSEYTEDWNAKTNVYVFDGWVDDIDDHEIDEPDETINKTGVIIERSFNHDISAYDSSTKDFMTSLGNHFDDGVDFCEATSGTGNIQVITQINDSRSEDSISKFSYVGGECDKIFFQPLGANDYKFYKNGTVRVPFDRYNFEEDVTFEYSWGGYGYGGGKEFGSGNKTVPADQDYVEFMWEDFDEKGASRLTITHDDPQIQSFQACVGPGCSAFPGYAD